MALVLLCAGVLAVAGTSALALRMAADARIEREATARAANRAALLSAHGCSAPSSASLEEGGIRERWLVSPVSPDVALVDVRVDWHARRGARSFTLASAILC